MQLEEIKQELERIKIRNKRVEADKSWETSFTRRGYITVITYIVASVWLIIIDQSNPFLKAAVPTIGYILSTLSLPIIKENWIKRREQKLNNSELDSGDV